MDAFALFGLTENTQTILVLVSMEQGQEEYLVRKDIIDKVSRVIQVEVDLDGIDFERDRDETVIKKIYHYDTGINSSSGHSNNSNRGAESVEFDDINLDSFILSHLAIKGV
jgi:hypothetical protein